VDDNYNVYVSERSNSRVLKWTADMSPESDGIVVAGTGIKGSAADQLSWPRAVFVDNRENLYVIDRDNTRIQYWPKGASHGTTVVAHSNARVLLGMKVDVSGNIYAVDWKKR
jgi:outer membrane receptor for ferric coprogen and ferric-rhodotorulic acid